MVFGQKFEIFPSFYYSQNQQAKSFDDILERKKAFLDYKKQKIKKVNNWDFSKAFSPWF